MLRRVERARRRELTARIAPISADEGGDGLDLFGEPLAEPDEDARARPEEASRAALVQTRALPIAHTIVAHMAWLRAHHNSLLLARFPRSEWEAPDSDEEAKSDSSSNTPPMVRKSQARRCAGGGCLARARAGIPRNPAVSGRGTGRCATCRADELLAQCSADLSRLLATVPAARRILRPQPPDAQAPPHA